MDTASNYSLVTLGSRFNITRVGIEILNTLIVNRRIEDDRIPIKISLHTYPGTVHAARQ